MKIIHCSDLHLDADLRSRFDAGSAAERRAELMNTFRRLCRRAQEIGACAILICGDLFDTDSPSASAVSSFCGCADADPDPPHPVSAAAAMIVHISALKSLFFMIIFCLSGERHRWGHENRGAFALSAIMNS